MTHTRRARADTHTHTHTHTHTERERERERERDDIALTCMVITVQEPTEPSAPFLRVMAACASDWLSSTATAASLEALQPERARARAHTQTQYCTQLR